MSDKNRRYPVDRSSEYAGVVPIHDPDRANFLYPSDVGYYDEPEKEGVDFWGVVRIVMSRKWMILAITLIGVALSIALTLRVTPLYSATATIEIQQQDVQVIEGTAVGPTYYGGDAYMETQYRLLRSRFLAERVAEELNLPNDARYAFPGSSREGRLRQAAGKIVGGLSVAPAGRSLVVNVSYISPHPQEAARIANAVVESFIQTNLERKYNTTAFAREFLDERLTTTKAALEDSERRLGQYAEEQGLLDIGAGSLDETSIVALNAELGTAESERIKAEQDYRAALATPPSRELVESGTLTAMRQNRAELISDYQQMLSQFKPDYPDMVRLQARIDLLDDNIAEESETIVQSIMDELKASFDAAIARENSLRSRVDELKGDLRDERNRRIQYRILQREVETIRAQYEALLQRSKEISISSGIGSSNISFVDEALVPGAPFQPNLNRSIMQALILSFAFGIGLAFALNFIDDTIKTPDDVRAKLGLPTIGVVPKHTNKKDLITHTLNDPKSVISEAFASARTALEFATEDGAPRSLLITSTRPNEGKTTTTIAMATTFARGGKRVLIIDADMRKPSFIIDSNESIGLSGLLTGHESLQDHVVQSKTEGLSILPAGIVPPNPAQLLSGPRLREVIEAAEELYDIVIVDSPPLLSFTDSPRLGSVVGGALLVLQAGLIRTPAAKRTVSQLYDSRTNIIGGVLTKFDPKKAGFEYGYYYSSYSSGARSYVESKKDSAQRKILIEAAPDVLEPEEHDESEKWA